MRTPSRYIFRLPSHEINPFRVNNQCPAVNARFGAINVAVHKLPLAVSS